jgi:hypothetical protein
MPQDPNERDGRPINQSAQIKPGHKNPQAPGYSAPDEESAKSSNRGGENPHDDELYGQGADEAPHTTAGNDPRRMGYHEDEVDEFGEPLEDL